MLDNNSSDTTELIEVDSVARGWVTAATGCENSMIGGLYTDPSSILHSVSRNSLAAVSINLTRTAKIEETL